MGGGLAGVDCVLEPLVDVLPPYDDLRVDSVVLEEAGAGGPGDAVGPVLDLLDLPDLVGRAVEPLQPAEQRLELARGLDEQAAELERLPRRLLDVVEPEQLRGVLDRVRDVVDGEGERDEVLPVERRDELGADRSASGRRRAGRRCARGPSRPPGRRTSAGARESAARPGTRWRPRSVPPSRTGRRSRGFPVRGRTASPEDRPQEQIEERRDGCRGRDRQDPRDDDVAGDAPADGREALGRSRRPSPRPRSTWVVESGYPYFVEAKMTAPAVA